MHIAIIMDGNGRWAKKKLVPKKVGHKTGAKTLKTIANYCNSIGINQLTCYAFSTENWKRDKEEVEYLMELLNEYLDDFVNTDDDFNIKITGIGNIEVLNESLQNKLNSVIEQTKNNAGLNLCIAINYGSRDEIIRAVKKVTKDVQDKKILVENINEEVFSNYLDTANMKDPDLLIRTSNELRLSNFLLWQVSYSELYFTKKLWPDFNEKDINKAINEYNKRNRRYGGRSK